MSDFADPYKHPFGSTLLPQDSPDVTCNASQANAMQMAAYALEGTAGGVFSTGTNALQVGCGAANYVPANTGAAGTAETIAATAANAAWNFGPSWTDTMTGGNAGSVLQADVAGVAALGHSLVSDDKEPVRRFLDNSVRSAYGTAPALTAGLTGVAVTQAMGRGTEAGWNGLAAANESINEQGSWLNPLNWGYRLGVDEAADWTTDQTGYQLGVAQNRSSPEDKALGRQQAALRQQMMTAEAAGNTAEVQRLEGQLGIGQGGSHVSRVLSQTPDPADPPVLRPLTMRQRAADADQPYSHMAN